MAWFLLWDSHRTSHHMNYETPLMNSIAFKFKLVKLALIENGKGKVLFGQVVQSSAYQLPLRKIYDVNYQSDSRNNVNEYKVC